MTQPFEFKQSGHLSPELLDPSVRISNAEKLTGRWLNTNKETRGIAEINIERDGERFSVSAQGVGADGTIEWPLTEAKVLANLEEEAGQRTSALAVNFDFDFMRAEAYLRVNKGVLVIVLFNTFRDDSGRSSYVNREFFHRPD
jgi:hypothetical protein